MLLSQSCSLRPDIFPRLIPFSASQAVLSVAAHTQHFVHHRPFVPFPPRPRPFPVLRPEAVKLFYQVLVTHSTSFINAQQDKPYGDIRITSGRLL